MSNLELIERLCGIVGEASDIIREQDALLRMHGIVGEGTTEIERRTTELLEAVERGGYNGRDAP